MTTTAQTQANRRNAQASTGPITAAGKAASSLNAISHGLASAHFALLPGEDPHAYAAHLRQFAATFLPKDCHEAHLVEILVQSKWKLNRAKRMESALVLQMMEADATHNTAESVIAAALLAGTAGPYKTLQRYQAAAERSYDKAMRQLLAYRQPPQPAAQPEKSAEPNEPKSASPAPAKQYFGPHPRIKKFARPARRPGCPSFEKLLRAHRIAV